MPRYYFIVAYGEREIDDPDGEVLPNDAAAIEYAAASAAAAKAELERRLLGQEVFGYQIENVVAATGAEAAQLNLPDGCVMLLA
jgi:hypothetical protein